MSRHVCFYISDHGFGHVMRCAPIMEELLKRGVSVTAVCGSRQLPSLQAYLGTENIRYRADEMDVGLILTDGTLEVDEERLQAATERYLSGCAEHARREADWLRANDVDAAVCDMPLWSIEACELAGVPLQYIGNFTWTELYREHLPASIWQAYAAQYNRLKHVMVYHPHNEEMREFLRGADTRDVSLVARRFHEDAVYAIRSRHTRPLVFVALGMSARFTQTVDVSDCPYDFVVNQGVPLTGENVYRLRAAEPNTQDYIMASDYVITKAGWGTVAECLLAKKKMALFARDSVLEDRTTIRILEEQKLAVKISPEDLKGINAVIGRMRTELSAEGFALYYDSVKDIADGIMQLNKGAD